MRVFDVMAWVVVALATVKTIYYVVMLATGPARARRAARRGAHVRVALTGTGAPREAWQEASGAVIAVAAGILLLTVNSMSHKRQGATLLKSLMPGPAGGRARHRDREAKPET
jgi:hypothetical protein